MSFHAAPYFMHAISFGFIILHIYYSYLFYTQSLVAAELHSHLNNHQKATDHQKISCYECNPNKHILTPDTVLDCEMTVIQF